MTVIRPNSISGVTSITALANEINVFRHNGVLAGLQLNGVNHHTSAGVSTFHTLNVLGNLDVAGVLTYQDVTNVDSVGIITARQGIHIDDSIVHIGDSDTKIRFPDADTISFETGGSTRAKITSTGNFEMPNDNDYIKIGAGGDLQLVHTGSASYISNSTGFLEIQAPTITFENTSGTERARIDSSGRMLVGRTGSRMVGGSSTYAKLQIAGTSQSDSSISIVNNENNTNGAFLFIGKTRGGSVNTSTIVQNGDTLGGLSFIGADSTDLNNRTAEITAVVNGSPSNNTIPTDLTFSTSTQNATQMAERMRIYSSGRILIGNGGSEHSPSGNLDIVGDTNSNGPELYLRVSNNNTTDNIGALLFGNNADKSICMIRGSTHTANNTGDIEFHTSTTGTMTERLRIKNTGTIVSTITSPSPYNTVNENITIVNGAGNSGAGSKVRFATGAAEAHIESRVTGGNSGSGTSLNFATSPNNQGAEEAFRITPSGNILVRARPYSNTHQPTGWGMGRYLKSGWVMAQSSFSNPVVDLVDLLDQGNAYHNIFFKVTAMQIRFRGSNNPEGQIHTGYASAKRDPGGSNTWFAYVGTMQLENAASGFGSGSNVGSLSWSAVNNFNTATLRYTGNREDNYDTYQVCVEVWTNTSDSLGYKLSSGMIA